MVNKPKNIGTRAETAVVRYLHDRGWTQAERRALRGIDDAGDICGTPGIAWEVKGGKAATTASEGLIVQWLADTERERIAAGEAWGILVTQRAGYGPTRAGSWWAWLTLDYLATLVEPGSQGRVVVGGDTPVRLPLSAVVDLLQFAGYGSQAVSA